MTTSLCESILKYFRSCFHTLNSNHEENDLKIMETIPEVLKKADLKLYKLKPKDHKQSKIKNPAQPSENERHFVDQILKRDAENTLKKLTLNSSKSEYFTTRGRRSLKSINLASTLAAYTDTSGFILKSESQERQKNSKSHLKLSAHSTPIKCGNVLSFAQIAMNSKPIEEVFSYFVGNGNNDLLIRKIMKKRKNWVKVPLPHSANFIWTQVRKTSVLEMMPRMLRQKRVDGGLIRIYNRLEGNFELTTKKKLFVNMCNYYKMQSLDPFQVIPMTFHFTQGRSDPNFPRFCLKFQEIQTALSEDSKLNNLWVIKPGESTNRGCGISISNDLLEISSKISEKLIHNSQQRTFIVQKYLYRPLLYKGRKFDIRCYALITCINNQIQAFFYKEGYLRTSSQFFSLDISDKYVHLTNDAIQKNSLNYGSFEDSNKLSYSEFQSYLNETFDGKIDFYDSVLPRIQNIVKDSVLATYPKLNPSGRIHCFELLGYDFMLDEFFTPWLIEVNTNPCLELSGRYLTELIPKVVEEALEIVFDKVFGKDSQAAEGFELIFIQK